MVYGFGIHDPLSLAAAAAVMLAIAAVAALAPAARCERNPLAAP